MSEAEETFPAVNGFPDTRNVRIVGGPDAAVEPPGSAFAALAAIVEHAATATVVPDETGARGDEPWLAVHPFGPQPGGSHERRKREALDALVRAEGAHREALGQADEWWAIVHEREQRLAAVTAEEVSAFVALEVIRDRRRVADRELRRARYEAEAASHQGVVTSRDLEDARHRAVRL